MMTSAIDLKLVNELKALLPGVTILTPKSPDYEKSIARWSKLNVEQAVSIMPLVGLCRY